MPGVFVKTAIEVEISLLLSVLNGKGIKCVSIRKKDGGFKLFCDSYTDVDGIFEEEVISALRRIKCDPVMPRDLKAKRSLIVKSCGAVIYDRDINEIKEEIEKVNNLKVCDAFKLPNSKALKVILKSQKMVTDACERGLSLFDLYISPRYFLQDSYTPLLICYK